MLENSQKTLRNNRLVILFVMPLLLLAVYYFSIKEARPFGGLLYRSTSLPVKKARVGR
jgi:hypothetical protein